MHKPFLIKRCLDEQADVREKLANDVKRVYDRMMTYIDPSCLSVHYLEALKKWCIFYEFGPFREDSEWYGLDADECKSWEKLGEIVKRFIENTAYARDFITDISDLGFENFSMSMTMDSWAQYSYSFQFYITNEFIEKLLEKEKEEEEQLRNNPTCEKS